MPFTEQQLAEQALAHFRGDAVECSDCGTTMESEDRFNGTKTSRDVVFQCRGCNAHAQYSEPDARDPWTEDEQQFVMPKVRGGERVACPRDGVSLDTREKDSPGLNVIVAFCPYCGRHTLPIMR